MSPGTKAKISVFWEGSLSLWGSDGVANLCSYLVTKKRPSQLLSSVSRRGAGLYAINGALAPVDLELILK